MWNFISKCRQSALWRTLSDFETLLSFVKEALGLPGLVLSGVVAFFAGANAYFEGKARYEVLLIGLIVFVLLLLIIHLILKFRNGYIVNKWRKQSFFERAYLELYELAYLSTGKTPKPKKAMPRDVLHRHRFLKDAIESGNLHASNLNDDGKPNVVTKIHINDFSSYLDQYPHKAFLKLSDMWVKFHHEFIIDSGDKSDSESERADATEAAYSFPTVEITQQIAHIRRNDVLREAFEDLTRKYGMRYLEMSWQNTTGKWLYIGKSARPSDLETKQLESLKYLYENGYLNPMNEASTVDEGKYWYFPTPWAHQVRAEYDRQVSGGT